METFSETTVFIYADVQSSLRICFGENNLNTKKTSTQHFRRISDLSQAELDWI